MPTSSAEEPRFPSCQCEGLVKEVWKMDDRVWYPQLEKHHSIFFSGKLYDLRETSTEAQGLSLAHINTISENCPLCIETETPLDFSGWHNNTVFCIFKPVKEIKSDSVTTFYKKNRGLPNQQMFLGGSESSTRTTCGISAVPLIGLPNTPDYIWVEQNLE